MYVPARFEMANEAEKVALIKECDFGIVVTSGAQGLCATHVPFFLDEMSAKLSFHLAAANPQIEDLRAGDEVLVIFAGPHAYTSPAWYTDRTRVPTWNYLAVHVYGQVRELADDDRVHAELVRMVNAKEKDSPAAWSVDEVPPHKLAALKNAITMFECEITRIEGKAKLDQNKSPQDRVQVAEEYEKQGFSSLAEKIRTV